MASKPGQQTTKKKRIPKKYDHNLKPEVIPEADSRQHQNKNKVIELNYSRLEKYMWTRPTLQHTALFFDVSPDTIENVIKERYALSFSDFREKHIKHSKHLLVQTCMSLALEQKDFRALKFALQNLGDWSDNVNVSTNQSQPIQLKYNLDKPPEPIIDVTPAAATNNIDSKVSGE